MSWFTLLLLISTLTLFLWVSVGIYLDIKQRVLLASERTSEQKRRAGKRNSQADAWRNLTTAQVREAFDLFLQSQG
jgi:hypothetical protein